MLVDSFPRGDPSPTHNKNHFILIWVSPPTGLVKQNFDDSCIDLSTLGGFILREWMGQLLKLGACDYGTTFITVAEVRAMRDGILMAIQPGFQRIVVEGDNKTVIQAAQGFGRAP
uniref:RNase H type-1 domain-containing protein n=1 Tax=Opuntia streptacantha TaxID=393608 RepID=A0A7C9D1H1_OPUST